MKKLFVCLFGFALLFTAAQTNASAAGAGDKNCGDFSSTQEVMKFWKDNGYSASNDPHDLDRDSDGLPCEVSQSEYDSFVASTDDSKEEDTSGTKEDTSDTNEDSDDNSTTVTNDDTNKDDDASKSDESTSTTSDSKEGEKLPETASNAVTMMGLSAVLLAAGSLLVFRKKQTN
ncbi:excalibur calcium-binding domain-containing protein [Peribacillus frigoritolerans]|uniref:excalibur calcium-binding domain-containing protein n=1 Tax=Peribacillus frigoritolerans TaxID=450367 RepID=UPI000BBA390E|nr:excalibur calcium-binding domain-containing protein [Peribacillus frigoritolerans]MCK2020499.1 excalibur calcium-binding domain-containing protein [Peribacillus frigoritolerans]PCD05673.1 cell wall anchor protein [Peribacillus simplex]